MSYTYAHTHINNKEKAMAFQNNSHRMNTFLKWGATILVVVFLILINGVATHVLESANLCDYNAPTFCMGLPLGMVKSGIQTLSDAGFVTVNEVRMVMEAGKDAVPVLIVRLQNTTPVIYVSEALLLLATRIRSAIEKRNRRKRERKK